MRIVEVREKAVTIASPIRSACIDFGVTTASAAAVTMPDLPGIGFESKTDLYRPTRELLETP